MSTYEDRLATLRAARSKLSKKPISMRFFAGKIASSLGLTSEGAREFLSKLKSEDKQDLNIGIGYQRKQVLAKKRERRVDRISYAKKREIATKKLLTGERVLHEIVQIQKKGGRLNPKIVREIDPGLYTAALREFGSWSKAVNSAGHKYVPFQREKPPQAPIQLLSLNVVLDGGKYRFKGAARPVTLEDMIGAHDPEFAHFEDRETLRVVREMNGLHPGLTALFDQVIAGEDIEDTQYKELAEAIRGREDLMSVLKAA